jgi:chorismate mutase
MINNRKLKKARNKIDQIDRDIFNHIKKRTNVIKHMLSLKMYKKQIIDYNRINEILKNIKKKSIKNGIDPKITVRIWKSMIWSYIEFQKKNFRKK